MIGEQRMAWLHETRWQKPARSSGGQSSADTWEHAKPKRKWIEVSADYHVVQERKGKCKKKN